jgi:flavin reductase (DIM6/NTAB) family NADH-FMN oxidoreductase RutF
MRVDQYADTELRRILGSFPTGVTAVAALVDGRPAGLAANSFTSVSLCPPIVSICIAHSSSTWPLLRAATRLGISVLGADHAQVCRQLNARTGDWFRDIAWNSNGNGAVFIERACAWFECRILQHVPAGDHDVVLLEVCKLLAAPSPTKLLVFHGSRFRELGVFIDD